MANKTDEMRNRITIDLKTGLVEIASDKESLTKIVKTAEGIAKRMSSKNSGEWGIH